MNRTRLLCQSVVVSSSRIRHPAWVTIRRIRSGELSAKVALNAPREVFADRVAAVIIAHNHPSGDLRPSDNDLRTHSQLTEAAKILGLRVLDHVIVGKKGHDSFQESGLTG